MQRCKKERGFTLPAVYSYFVTKPLDLNSVESVIHNKCVIFQVLLLPSNILLNFCLRWKLLSKKFLVVITRLRFITLWIFCMSGLYDKHVFELREDDELIKLDHIEQSIVVKLTSKRRCCSTTVKIYSLWESTYKGLVKENGIILVSYKLFTGEPITEVPVNINFCSNFYQYFLQ